MVSVFLWLEFIVFGRVAVRTRRTGRRHVAERLHGVLYSRNAKKQAETGKKQLI